MIELGNYNTLTIKRSTRVGLFLGDDDVDDLLLPNKYVPDDFEIGQELRVFCYLDHEERPIATTLEPLVTRNTFGYLEVAEVNQFGAFLNWGLEKHLLAPFRICRAAAPYFRDAGRREAREGQARHRKVVMVSSLAASFGNPGAGNYAAAKGGLIGLTKTLAAEWGSANVNVNAVSFGIIQTRFGAPQSAQQSITVGGREIPLGVPDKTLQAMGFDPDEDRDLYAPRKTPGTALGRTGTIQEAADAIFWLASPLSNYVTGQVIPVSGGARGGMS